MHQLVVISTFFLSIILSWLEDVELRCFRHLVSKIVRLNSCVNMSSGIFPSFLGAVRAPLAVLLTISYGVIASRTNILKPSSSRDISKVCVRLFLLALLISNVGNELHINIVVRYIPVLSRCNSIVLRSGYLSSRV